MDYPTDTALLVRLRAGEQRAFRELIASYQGAMRAVAIAIDMFGVAANFSARVLSWRKEFDQLAHLVPTRRQILQLVALGPPAVVPGCGADRHGDRRAGRERRLVNGNQAVCWRLRQPIPSSKATSTASAARVMSGT